MTGGSICGNSLMSRGFYLSLFSDLTFVAIHRVIVVAPQSSALSKLAFTQPL